MHRLIFRCLFLLVCAAAATAPLVSSTGSSPIPVPPKWPEVFEQRVLFRLPLNDMEKRFNAGFPGAVARYSDGERQFIFRWVTAGTRKLHSSADCFRGLGYKVTPASALRDRSGAHWSCFTAVREAYHLRVKERITDLKSGRAWTDTSAWFWSATLQQSSGPWLATTVVENG